MMMENLRTYSKLIKLPTFEERFEYLDLKGSVGKETFGFDRYLNQKFYMSREWQDLRREVILRDNACDLGIEGREIYRYLFIHHMNPITINDVERMNEFVWDPEYLICCSRDTHNAIHYGSKENIQLDFVDRKSGDTKLW